MQEIEATPEEEELLQQALQEAGKLIYSEGPAGDAMIEAIQSAPNPSEGVGTAAATATITVDTKMDLPDDMIFPLFEHLLPLVAEVAEAAGAALDEAGMQKAAVAGIKNLGDEYGADEEGLKALMAGMSPEELRDGEKLIGGLVGEQKQ